jgi:hypothetical protein
MSYIFLTIVLFTSDMVLCSTFPAIHHWSRRLSRTYAELGLRLRYCIRCPVAAIHLHSGRLVFSETPAPILSWYATRVKIAFLLTEAS